MSTITSWWDDETDIAEYTEADFGSRTATLSIYDQRGIYKHVLEGMSDELGFHPKEVADVCIRLYIAALADAHSKSRDIRRDFEQTILVPQRGWLAEEHNRLPRIDVNVIETADTNRQITPSSTETVREMINSCIDEYDMHEGLSDFDRAAVTFVVDLLDPETRSIDDIDDLLDRTRLHLRENNRQRNLFNIDDKPALTDEHSDTRDEQPLPLNLLTQTKNHRDLLYYFLSTDIPDRGYNKTTIAEESGVSANGIRRHIDVFLSSGIVKETTSPDARITRYTNNPESELHTELVNVNNILISNSDMSIFDE